MRVAVRDTRLFVEVMGPKLVPDGWTYWSRPTIVLLHGGQGFADHTVFHQPGLPYKELGQLAQLVAIDLRGHGRSDRGDPGDWNLAGWAADVTGIIDVLGLERPVLLGESGGGFVALQLAQDHPGLLGGLILASTSAHWSLARVEEAFRRRGGPVAAAAAVRFWTDPGAPGASEDWSRLCLPLYGPPAGWPPSVAGWRDQEPAPSSALADLIPDRGSVGLDVEVFAHFSLGEMAEFDFRPALPNITCPVLIVAGTDDPICPVEDSDDIAKGVPRELLQYERVEGAGHTVAASDPDRFLAAVKAFIDRLASSSELSS